MLDNRVIRTIIISVTVIVVAFVIYKIIDGNREKRMDEQEAVTCGNKQVYRYKFPSEVFPTFTRDYNSAISLTSDVLQKLSDSLGNTQFDVNAKSKVIELQEKLNQDNITFSTALRSYFMNSNADPCNDTLRQKYLAFTDEMTRRMLELKSVNATVATITKSETAVDTATANPGTSIPVDTVVTTAPVPTYELKKDSVFVKRSINKLDVLLQENKNFNRVITMPVNKFKLKG